MDDLFRLLFKATSVEPTYHEEFCLAVKQSASVCSECRDVCPHQAVTIKRKVEIDDIDCTGCGLCVQACPSQALEANVRYQPSAALKCSRVSGKAETIHCLGRLQPSDLVVLNTGRKTTLAHADCSRCPIGTEATKETIETTRQTAEELSELLERPLDIVIVETEALEEELDSEKVSRRDLFRRGWRNVQHVAAEALAPLAIQEEDGSLPTEMQRQYQIIEAADLDPISIVPWRLPRVAEGCILCPVCTNVCPTKAFRRDFEAVDRDGTVLALDPERCMGCDACVKACPVKVITMDENVTWKELSGGAQEAYYKDPRKGPKGGFAR